MKYLVESMIEDIKGMRPDVYPVDSDSLGDTYVTYCKCIDHQSKEYEAKIREIIAASPKIHVSPDAKVLNEEFPTYAAISSPLNASATMSIANLSPIITNCNAAVSEDEAMKKFSNGLAGEITKGTSCPYNNDLQNAVNYMGSHITNTNTASGSYLQSCQASLIKKVLNTVSVVYGIADMFKGFDKCETQEQYQAQANIFTSILTDIASVVKLYMTLHDRVYSMGEHKPSETEMKYKLAKHKMDTIKSGLDKHIDVQNRWNKIHTEPNHEIERRIENLNEKYVEAKDEVCMSEAAWNDEMSNDISRYSESLRGAIDDARGFYNKYQYKEFLKPSCRHIDKMDEYIRGALCKEYAMRIPMYSSSNKSARIRDMIRNDFVPGLSKAIANRKEYCVICPAYDTENEDVFIYITLREPTQQNEAAGTSVENWTPEMFKVDRSGRDYKVYDPNGKFVCNTDAGDLQYDIKTYIEEEQEKARKSINNESAYCLFCIDEATLTAKERNEMPTNQFGVPEIKGYPLNDRTHIEKAIQFFNFAKNEYKQELAKNIEKAVIANRLVGQVNVGKKHPARKYFHDWMITDSGAVMNDNKDGTYSILMNGKVVSKGTFNKASRTEESTSNDGELTESSIQLFI